MAARNVGARRDITINSERTVREAARKMCEAGVACLMVAECGSVKGIITDRDLAMGCLGAGHNPSRCHVYRHMRTAGQALTAPPSGDQSVSFEEYGNALAEWWKEVDT